MDYKLLDYINDYTSDYFTDNKTDIETIKKTLNGIKGWADECLNQLEGVES